MANSKNNKKQSNSTNPQAVKAANDKRKAALKEERNLHKAYNATYRVPMTKGYNFLVYFDEIRMSFMRVSSIEKSITLESYSEGGINGRAYQIERPYTSENTMTFERGLARADYDSRKLEVGHFFTKDVCIYITGDDLKPQKAYYLSGAVVKKVSIGEFDASRSELVVERIEVSYEMLTKETFVKK